MENARFDFDEIVERRQTGCVKWDESPEGVIPLWVADMDFAVAPAILEAIRRRAEHPVYGYTYVMEDYYEAAPCVGNPPRMDTLYNGRSACDVCGYQGVDHAR